MCSGTEKKKAASPELDKRVNSTLMETLPSYNGGKQKIEILPQCEDFYSGGITRGGINFQTQMTDVR